MAITDQIHRVQLADIFVDRELRQRREIQTADLEKSIARIGLINPVIVERHADGRLWLKAGERRFTACKNLGHLDILARFAQDLSETERQVLELEENIKRQDLSWQDHVQATSRIHRLYCELDGGWTASRTAEAVSLNEGHISMFLTVAKNWEDEKIREAGTAREAYNIILRREKRTAGDQLQELLDVLPEAMPEATPEEQIALRQALGEAEQGMPTEEGQSPVARPAPLPVAVIQQGSFLEWVKTYSGPKFNLIHCDFPYGVNLFAGEQGRSGEEGVGAMYDDSEDVYWQLLETLLRERNRFMSVSCHLMFWYSAKHYEQTRQMFAALAPEIEFRRHSLIWVKSDNAGIIADSRRDPRHIYETALLASRGDRFVLRSVADAYSGPTDKRLHPSTKPEPMLRHFFSMLVDDTTLILDPTAGSGASLRAADSLGAKHLLGLELDPEYARVSEQAFQQSRLKARGAKLVADLGL